MYLPLVWVLELEVIPVHGGPSCRVIHLSVRDGTDSGRAVHRGILPRFRVELENQRSLASIGLCELAHRDQRKLVSQVIPALVNAGSDSLENAIQRAHQCPVFRIAEVKSAVDRIHSPQGVEIR